MNVSNARVARCRFENERDIIRALENAAMEHAFEAQNTSIKLAEKLANDAAAKAIRDAATARQTRLNADIAAYEAVYGEDWRNA